MKPMHIHIAVNELSQSIGFYSTIFGAAPSVQHDDYAKWELAEIAQRLEAAQINASAEKGTACCYTRSNKHWALDSQGIAWESFHTLGHIPVFGGDTAMARNDESSACCIPHKDNAGGCCA